LNENLTASPAPRVTISLVTHQGMRWLPGCVGSVQAQDFADWRLWVLDNASSDGTTDWLRSAAARDPRIQLTESPINIGFAAGQNRTIRSTAGDYVVLLNQDVELDPGFLGAAVAALDERPAIGSLQARLLRLAAPGERTDVVDSTGLEMLRSRRVVSRRQGEQQSAGDRIAGPAWGADGPVPVYRRSALMDAALPSASGLTEVLDEDFFMYKEDVDLAWRLRLLGWGAWYEPAATAWHGRTAGGPPARSLLDIAMTNRTIPSWIKAISWRNQRLMQVKNEQPHELLRDLPWVAGRELLSLGFIALADPARLASLGSLATELPSAARKRRALMCRVSVRRGRAQ
jgi:GT2 family glycosyltransferase